MSSKLCHSLLLLPALAVAIAIDVLAQGFAAGITPSRFARGLHRRQEQRH